jgi:hypothetical protein
MISPQLPTVFLIAGIIFLLISVVGQAQLGFVAINPGCFGRFLALIIGIISLIFAVSPLTFSPEMLDAVRTYITDIIQQNANLFNEFSGS